MKTKKTIFLLAIFALFFSVSASARDRIVDNAFILLPEDKKALTDLINSVSTEYHFDLVIVLEPNIVRTEPGKFAEDFFDENGYGQGENKDGCLFLNVTGKRDYWFSPSGRGIKILNSNAFNKLEEAVVGKLKDGKPTAACKTFILTWQELLKMEASGKYVKPPLFDIIFQSLMIMGGVLVVLLLVYFVFFAERGSGSGYDDGHPRGYRERDSDYSSSSSDRDSDSSSRGGGGKY